MHLRTKGYIFPKKIINQEILTYTIPVLSFPDFDAVRCTFIGLYNVFSTIGRNFPFVSCNTKKRGDNNFPSAVIVVCIV